MSKHKSRYSALILVVSLLLVANIAKAEDAAGEAGIECTLAGRWIVRYSNGETGVMWVNMIWPGFGLARIDLPYWFPELSWQKFFLRGIAVGQDISFEGNLLVFWWGLDGQANEQRTRIEGTWYYCYIPEGSWLPWCWEGTWVATRREE